ncbi:MAG: VOC family protein [Pseudomonadota bacterium]
MANPETGNSVWLDLTIEDAGAVKDFYSAVCGWVAEDHDMGDYVDFSMKNDAGDVVAGICHARGDNAKLPPVWLPYIVVEDLDSVIETARQKGGTVVDERRMGRSGGIAVIQDPAGAYLAFWQKPQT